MFIRKVCQAGRSRNVWDGLANYRNNWHNNICYLDNNKEEIKMKKLFLIMAVVSMFLVSFVNAETLIIQDPIANPYSVDFTILGETGMTYDNLKTCLGVDSCYVEANYEAKACDYLYFCTAILPWDSTNIGDALLRECADISEAEKILSIKDFVPPRGILYYSTTFFTVTHHTYNDATEDWNNPTATIPETCGSYQLINARDIRAVCPEGQLLAIKRDSAGVIYENSFGCYLSQRRCLDEMNTGMCTNPYDLYVLDLDGDGNFEEHYDLANAYCRDGDHNQVCDYKIDWSCADICSSAIWVDDVATCVPGSNAICDIYDFSVLASCADDELSPHSGICDDIDTSICGIEFVPVCVAATYGETVNGKTYPNECYAESQGFGECPSATPETNCWVPGQCTVVDPECYQDVDCIDLDVCASGQVLDKTCLNYKCYYSGSCTTSQCETDADCEHLETVCVGIDATCNVGAGICTVTGSCISQPLPEPFNLWNLIQNIWNSFWAFILSLFGA